jgi:hypothetical protein
MATRSCIIIKVNKEDIGRVVKFNARKLPLKRLDWSAYNEKKKREFSQPVTLENEYIGIYCHWDGYPDGVGKVLKNKFNTYDKVMNLIAGGWCSSVDYDGVRHYANRDKENWEYIKPTQMDKLNAIGCWVEYAYVFKNNKWYYGNVKWGDGDNPDTIGKLKEL